MSEPGHLFVARGDLTQLACDALLVPTDANLHVAADWRSLVAEVPAPTPDWPAQPLPVPGGGVIAVDAPTSEAAAAGSGPSIHLVATASLAEHGGSRAEVQRALDVLLDRVDAFVTAAADEVRRRGHGQRPRPLLGLPVVGTGAGGLRARPGAVVAALLRRLEQATVDLDVDVVVVAHSAEHEALCRHWRRRLWEERHGRADGYLGVVAERWRRGVVGDGEVRVASAADQVLQLRDRAAREQLVPFFGSGASRASGAPTWSELLDDLSPPGAKALFEQLAGQDRSHMADPFARAQVVAHLDATGGAGLRERLRARLAFERLSLLHVLLANLAARDAITTNFDVGYERACRAAGIDVSIVPSPSGSHRLVKLHGSLGEGGAEPLLTRDQLLDFTTERGPLAGVLQMLLLTGHLVFVGYSMSDPSLHAAIHAVRRALEHDAEQGTPRMATSLQIDPSPALAALWDGTVDVVWPCSERYRTRVERARQKEILLDLLADAASRTSIPLLAMDDEAATLDLGSAERDLRAALLTLDAASRRAGGDPLWEPVRHLLERFHGRGDA